MSSPEAVIERKSIKVYADRACNILLTDAKGKTKVRFEKEGEIIRGGSVVTVSLYVKNHAPWDYVVTEYSHPNPDVELKMPNRIPARRAVKLTATWSPKSGMRIPLRDGITIKGYFHIKA